MSHFASHSNRIALLTILAFALLGIAFSLVVPPFESPDELYHYGFVQHVAGGNGLPIQSTTSSGPWEQEGSQAPLYYMLVGALSAGIDQSDFDALAVRNPHANIGDPLYPGNKNRMLYSGGPPPPMQGANLALHLGRWLSVVLGLLTLAATYATAQLAFPGRQAAALAALAIVAFMPQFGFIAGSLNNDNMITAMAAVTVFWLARLVAMPLEREPSWKEWALLGMLLGLSALSKLQGLGLGLLAGLAALGMAWQRRDWRLPLRAFLPTALPIVLIAGWWYVRNLMFYGDLFGLSNLLEINGRRQEPLTWNGFLREFRGLRYSFWGLFGWFNILLPRWIYHALDLLTLLALGGLGWWLAQRVRAGRALDFARSQDRVRLLLLVWALLSLALLLYWTNQATGSQGRLIFPGLSAFAILLSGGLEAWLRHAPRSVARWGQALLPALLLGATLWTLALLLPQAYRAPAPIAALPNSVQSLDVAFGQDALLHLAGITLPDNRYAPGQSVPITLYAEVTQPPVEDYRLFIQLLDQERNVLGNVTTHPGWGRNPTTLWSAGVIYPDAYTVLIEEAIDVHSPLLATVYAGFIDPASGQADQPLSAVDGTGTPVTPFLGQVVITPHRELEEELAGLTALSAELGGIIEIVGVEVEGVAAGSMLPVRVLWQTLGRPATDYTAFVHLRAADGQQVAGVDEAPAQGRFPTSYWAAGDQILSEFVLPLPAELSPGTYELWLGLYESASAGALRLPVTDSGNLPSSDGEVQIGTVQIAGQ
jgi:hypothetical protein